MELIQRASGGSVNIRLPQLNNKKIHHPKPVVLFQQRCGGEDAAPSQFSCPSPGAKRSPAGSSSLGSVVLAGNGDGQPHSPRPQVEAKQQSRRDLNEQDHS